MTKKKKNKGSDKSPNRFAEFRLNPNDWEISTHFTKGPVSGGRGVVVTVIHLPSGKKTRKSKRATTKANAYLIADELVRDILSKASKPPKQW